MHCWVMVEEIDFVALSAFGCWLEACTLATINDMLSEVLRKSPLNEEHYSCLIFCLIVTVIYSRRLGFPKLGKIPRVLKAI